MHALSKNLKVNRNLFLNRLPPTLLPHFIQKTNIRINFKVLEFTEPVDSEVILFKESNLNMTPNYLIRETFSILFERYRNKLKSESSELEIMALKLGEKVDYLAGEEPLYCYEEIMNTTQLRKNIELVLVKLDRRKACRCPYSTCYSNNIGSYSPESDMSLQERTNRDALNNNLVLWQFPYDKSVLDTVQKDLDDDTLREFPDVALRSIKREINIRSSALVLSLNNVFLSDSIRSSYTFRIKKIISAHKLFEEFDFSKDSLEKNRYGLMGVVKYNADSKDEGDCR